MQGQPESGFRLTANRIAKGALTPALLNSCEVLARANRVLKRMKMFPGEALESGELVVLPSPSIMRAFFEVEEAKHLIKEHQIVENDPRLKDGEVLNLFEQTARSRAEEKLAMISAALSEVGEAA